MDGALLSTVLELARLGAVGIGAIVLVLSFILLFRSSSIDVEKAKLIQRFMTLGFVFGISAGILGLVPLFAAPSGPISQRLAFSPDFESEKLKPPTIRLPDGTLAQHNEKFDLKPSAGTQVVTIAMDATLNQVRNLRQASASLTSTVAAVTEQRDALAAKAVDAKTAEELDNLPVEEPKTISAAEALEYIQRNSENSNALKVEFSKSLQAGDYARANAAAGRLRNSANASAPAVQIITSPEKPR